MQYDQRSGLYLPPPMQPHSLGAFGKVIGGENVPSSGIKWPKEADHAGGIIDAVGSVVDVADTSFDQGGIVNPPIMAQIGALQATLESTTGMSLGQLVGLARNISALTNATDTVQITTAVNQLVQGSLQIAVSVMKAVGVATSAIQVVPILGQLVGIMMEVVAAAQAAQAQWRWAQDECQRRAEQQTLRLCQRRVSEARAVATEGSQPQPSDMFRPVFYAMQRKTALPLTSISIYVMLCGGETRGQIAGMSRTEWRALVDAMPNKRIGIPQSMQRKMWSLIKGIMRGSNYPQPGSPVMGDNGRALMPILQDMIWNLYRVGSSGPHQLPSRGSNYGIDEAFLVEISKLITKKHGVYLECNDLHEKSGWASGSKPTGGETCRSFVELSDPFIKGLRDYQNELMTTGLLRKDLTWNLNPPRLTPGAAKMAMIFVKGAALKRLTNISLRASLAATLSTSRAAAAKRKNDRKAAIATTSVVLGAGAFWAMRRRAKMAR